MLLYGGAASAYSAGAETQSTGAGSAALRLAPCPVSVTLTAGQIGALLIGDTCGCPAAYPHIPRLARLVPTVTLASGLLSGTGTYLDWGVIQISLANLVVVGLLVLLFVLALVLPFPGRPRSGGRSR